MNYNHVELAGNIVFDVELRTTAVQGMSILRNRLAVNKKYNGQAQVVFVDFVAIGAIAETINKYCGKGANIFIVGELQQNKWEKDGVAHERMEVRVDRMCFCGKANTPQKTDDADGSTVPVDATPPLDLNNIIIEADIPF